MGCPQDHAFDAPGLLFGWVQRHGGVMIGTKTCALPVFAG